MLLRLIVAGCAVGACNHAAQPVAQDEQGALRVKVRGYQDCLSEYASKVFLIEDIYRERFAESGTELQGVRVSAFPDPRDCIDAIDVATTMPPRRPDLERAGADFAAALSSVAGQLAAMRDSGTSNSAKLLASFNAFDRAEAELFDGAFRINRTAHLADLARREAAGSASLSLLAERTQIDAEGMLAYGAHEIDDTTDLTGLDTQLARFEDSIETMSAFAIGHPTQVAGFGDLSGFLDNARACAIAARQLSRRTRDHVPYSDVERLAIASGGEADVIGSPAALVRTYNKLAQIH